MNRLWVRLSLMIGGVLFLVFFMQYLSIVLIPDPIPEQAVVQGMPPDFEDESKGEIARRLIDFMMLSLGVGLAGGVVIARVISRPISNLSKAAHQIGQGDLSARVPVSGSLELQDMAKTFNFMAQELQNEASLRNNLMADVSHELRTPLTVLEGNLRAVLDHVYSLDEAEIANLYGQTHHLIRLVNDLRELALAETNQLNLEKQTTDLNALITETLQALEPLASEKGIQLKAQMSNSISIFVDSFRIRQVLFNLLSNALRHTSAGGLILINSYRSGENVYLEFVDTGEGLALDQLKSVFNRFYRGDKSRSRDTGGTGLGLAITKAIIEAHGGSIEVFSAGKGLGCTFSIILPVGQSEEVESAL